MTGETRVQASAVMLFEITAQPGPGAQRLREYGASVVACMAALGGDGDLSRFDGYADLPPGALVATLISVEAGD